MRAAISYLLLVSALYTHARTSLADKIRFSSLSSQKKDNNNNNNNTSAGGISQLRKSVDQSATSTASAADPMNLDDFLIPSSIGSPAGIPTSPAEQASTSGNTVASAIPIKVRKDQQAASHGNIAPASFPHPPQDQRRNNEFGYVQRRVRKTSVDERKVVFAAPYCAVLSDSWVDSQAPGRLLTPGATGI